MPTSMLKELTTVRDLNEPIPTELPSVERWKEIPIKENGEPLVPLGPFSEFDDIFTSSIYFGERVDSPYEQGLEGSLITPFIRQEVAEQLRKAQRLLPKGMHLVVFDSFRTPEVQKALYDKYFCELREQNPSWDQEQLERETQKYVSKVSIDPARPSPHNTGGAVDLVIFELPKEIEAQVEQLRNQIEEANNDWEKVYKLEMDRIALIRKNARLLDFGAPFDHGGEKAALDYLEKESKRRQLTSDEEIARKNRRLLYNLMHHVGLEPFQSEYWHYNSPKSQMGVKTAGKNFAEYGAAILSEENQKHEHMRQGHHKGTIILSGAKKADIGPPDKYMRAAKSAAQKSGDPRVTTIDKAEVITPPKK